MCNKEFGLRLKAYILKEGYTVSSFAKMLGVERKLLNKAIEGILEVEEYTDLLSVLDAKGIAVSTYPYEWLIEEDTDHWVGDRLCYKDSDEFKYLNTIGEVKGIAENVLSLLDKIDTKEYYRIKRNDLKTRVDLSDVVNLLQEAEKLLQEKSN